MFDFGKLCKVLARLDKLNEFGATIHLTEGLEKTTFEKSVMYYSCNKIT